MFTPQYYMNPTNRPNFLTNQRTHQWLMMTACVCMMVGFVASRAMVSIGMLTLVVVAVLHTSPVSLIKRFLNNAVLVSLTLFFWLVFISGLYSQNITEWLHWLRIKVPFLVLPIAFAGLPKLTAKQLVILLYAYVLVFFISTCAVLGNYFLHYDAVNQSFLSGSGIKMPYSHVRYSLMLCFSFFVALYLVRTSLYVKYEWEKNLMLLYAKFAFVSLHILAVRSGILALYIGLLFWLVVYVWQQKKYGLGFVVLIGLITLPVLAYQFSPTLQNKWKYMVYNWNEFRKGNINYQYDGMRYMSIVNGIEIWKQDKWWGCGAGDLTDKVHFTYSKTFPDLLPENQLMPHNQIVWTMASTGLLGVLLFLLAFFIPLTQHKNYHHILLTVLSIIVFSSFLTEATLEEQMGTGFYLLFTLLFITSKQTNE